MENKKNLEPKKFYIGHALNIGEGVEEITPQYVPVALSEYEDGVVFDEFSNQRVFIGTSTLDVMNDEFLGIDYIDDNNPYNLFVLKSTLVELPKESFNGYIKAYLMAPQFEEIKKQLQDLARATIRWREYLKIVKEEAKVKEKK